MAYMSQERKNKLAPAIKAALKAFGLKGTISVDNHSTLVVKVSEGKIDFIKNYNDTVWNKYSATGHGLRTVENYLDVNPYWYHDHFTGDALNAIKAIITAMMEGNHDNSDIQTDYFDVGWYINLHIGMWNKDYRVVA